MKFLAVTLMILALPVSAYAQQVMPSSQITSKQVVAPLDIDAARGLVDFVRDRGYQCRVPNLIRRCTFQACFEVRCDLQWTYTIRPTPQGGVSIQAE